MKQRLAIILTIVLVLGVLIALNAASYVQVEQTEDSELSPDRSTYNSGSTGTRALYDFLSESGRPVMRWRETPATLASNRKVQPQTFVVIGSTLVAFERAEVDSLLRWVKNGGRLVLIDRRPDARLLPAAGGWRVTAELGQYPGINVHPDNQQEMTAGVHPARASQPTVLTENIEHVMPSRFAGLIKLSVIDTEQKKTHPQKSGSASPAEEEEDESAEEDEPPPPPKPAPSPVIIVPKNSSGSEPPPPIPLDGDTSSSAPVVHLTGETGPLLVDYVYGRGRIVVLSDPYVVANGGISQADNLILAVNTLTARGGLVAFDEYHQGRSLAENHLFAYFKGTPVIAMLVQFGLIVLAMLWTRGRRFARPLPLARVDRRSTLEFVASMAELQQRARAFDLGIENIYQRTRRVLARYAGLNNNAPRAEIADGVASRSRLDQKELESIMRECEDAINGQPITARRAVELVARLREIEKTLGLRMRAREIKQAKEK